MRNSFLGGQRGVREIMLLFHKKLTDKLIKGIFHQFIKNDQLSKKSLAWNNGSTGWNDNGKITCFSFRRTCGGSSSILTVFPSPLCRVGKQYIVLTFAKLSFSIRFERMLISACTFTIIFIIFMNKQRLRIRCFYVEGLTAEALLI